MSEDEVEARVMRGWKANEDAPEIRHATKEREGSVRLIVKTRGYGCRGAGGEV